VTHETGHRTKGASRALLVFLCHSSNDKPTVRELYTRLKADAINPWLDEENLLPGQDWELEIKKILRNSDAVIICLSRSSVSREGYVQAEIKIVLRIADEKPEGTIFLIPLKLEECQLPESLSRYHYGRLFEDRGYERLLSALRSRASQLETMAAQNSLSPREIEAPLPIGDLPRELDELDSVLNLLLRPNERDHMINLEKRATKDYVGGQSLRDDLRRLRALGLIYTHPGRSISEMADQRRFDLADFVSLTNKGTVYLVRQEHFRDLPQ